MPLFSYKARRSDGETYEDSVEAPDRFSVYDHIRKEGATVVAIEEKSEKSLQPLLDSIMSFTGSVKMSEKIMLTRNLGTMVKAGLSLTRALSVVERQSKNARLQAVLNKLGSDVSKGTTLHEAMKGFPDVFSPLFVSMVRAGEESGKLVEAFTVLGRQMERSYQLQKKIRSALIYPAIIVIAMVVIGIVMLIYVVPTLTQTFEELGVELPTSTQLVITISNILTQHTLAAGLGLVVLIALSVFASKTPTGKRMLHFVLLHIPLITPIAREVNAARTTRTLASLLSAGVEMIGALSITKDVVQNSYYKEVLAEAEQNVQQGIPLSKAFEENEHLYPVLVGEMVSVGEETGQLVEMLEQIASFYEGEVEQQTKDLSTVIEPFLMLVIGTVVGFFAISMIAPIYSLSGSL
jgi:type IV pilus assembly protein PilC